MELCYSFVDDGRKMVDNMIAEAPCMMLTPVMTCSISDITDREGDTASGI